MNPYSKNNPYIAKFLYCSSLHQAGAAKSTQHVVVEIDSNEIQYKPGDAVGVFPQNDKDLVAKILSDYEFTGDELVKNESDNEVTLLDVLLTHEVTIIKRALLSLVTKFSQSDRVKELIKTPEASSAFLMGKDLLDIKSEFSCFCPTAQELVNTLRPLKPRLYSIASSLDNHPNQIHLTIGVVLFESGNRTRKGVTSNWLSYGLSNGDPVPCFIHEAKKFKLPKDSNTPIIMVGPGTGIAPFRAFLQERKVQKAQGKAWLFFGNQHRATDFLYEDESKTLMDEGYLTRLDTAFSRDQEYSIYVQDRVREHGEEVWKWIDSGACFYVCGDARRMAKDVDVALHEVIRIHGMMSEGRSETYVKQMKKDGRYQRDVYTI